MVIIWISYLIIERHKSKYYWFIFYPFLGRDSSVGTAIHYGLDGPGIESLWGVKYSPPVQTGPGAHPSLL
jgi:hypothetical protein